MIEPFITIKGHINIRISNSCQANCEFCPYGRYVNGGKTYFEKTENILKTLKRIFELIIWIDKVGILCDDISQNYDSLKTIISFIRETNKTRHIYISGEENIIPGYAENLQKIGADSLIYFLNSQNATPEKIISLTREIESLDFPKQYVIRMDFKKDKKLIELLLKLYGLERVSGEGEFITKGGTIIENANIGFDKKNITHTSYQTCLIKDAIHIEDDTKIILEKFLSVETSGAFYFHKIPCLLGAYKGFPVTNIYQSEQKIFSDFVAYQKFVKNKESGDMKRICTECIASHFDYRKNI